MRAARILIKRVLAILAAWAAGWSMCMIAMMMTTYDGFPSLVLQPFMAALVNTLFVGAALASGLLLRIHPVWRLWTAHRLWAMALALTCLLLLCLGPMLGLTEVQYHPDTQQPVVMLHPAVALPAYFGLIFGIANWPLRKPQPSNDWVYWL